MASSVQPLARSAGPSLPLQSRDSKCTPGYVGKRAVVRGLVPVEERPRRRRAVRCRARVGRGARTIRATASRAPIDAVSSVMPHAATVLAAVAPEQLTRPEAAAAGQLVATISGRSEVTWPIIVGAIAGVTPFVIASILFGRRIAQQRACKVCSGSGLELKGRFYRRCSACGGFLPWQSWRRFFLG